MATLSELLKELHTLPMGNIYSKRISGKIYYYHQYFLNGSRYSKIVNRSDVDDLKKQISRRKELEKLIKEKRSKSVTLSKSAKELTGYVMNENEIVAKFEKGALTFINEKKVPLIIKRTHSLEEFLKLRSMDMSRTNARILKKILNIEVDEDYKSSLYTYALSISDHYWFKPKHSKLTYKDIETNDDSLFEASLKGETNVFYHKAQLSPEITTTGSFEKGWRYIDKEWWLYKSGNNKQYFSEIFCSKFAKLMGIDTVEYEMDGSYIRCRNFSTKYNFEPIASLAGDNDNYQHVFDILYQININVAKEYLKLILFDSAVNNIDRHNENVGLLRNVKTGQVVSLAPNFDNNLSLIAVSDYVNDNPRKDGFIKVFVDFVNRNEQAKEILSNIVLPDIGVDEIKNLANSISIDVPAKEDIANAVFARYIYLKDIINNKHN